MKNVKIRNFSWNQCWLEPWGQLFEFSPETRMRRIPSKTLSSPSLLPSRVEPRKKPEIYSNWFLHRDCRHHCDPLCLGLIIIISMIVSIIILSVSSCYHHLFLASEDLPNGPALVVFQWQDLALRCCPGVVLATVPPGEKDCWELFSPERKLLLIGFTPVFETMPCQRKQD